MDGDLAPLREIVALKEKYGAWLMVDEAHATGFSAANRRGIGRGTWPSPTESKFKWARSARRSAPPAVISAARAH